MSHDEQYHEWLTRRRAVDAPAGFAGRVMATILQQDDDTQRHPALPLVVVSISSSTWGQCAACGAALLVGIVPYLIFLAGSWAL